MSTIHCRLCKIIFFTNDGYAFEDIENKTKINVYMLRVKNIRKRSNNILACRNCNSIIGNDNGHLFYELKRNQLVEIVDINGIKNLNEEYFI